MTSKRRSDRIAFLQTLAQQGFSKAYAARECGVHYSTVLRDADDFGIAFALGYQGGKHHNGSRSYPAIRKACIAGRGKLSAAEIAKKLGITRNKVIGHWFRARQQGLIT